MAYMEVQCFEMWGKVKLEKLQNYPSLVSHSILFLCWWKSFPMSLSLLSILTWTLTWIQTNVCTKQTNNEQTNKQSKMYGHLKRGLSQNVHHINHNKGITKLSGRGLICIDFHAYCHRDLWFHQCSLISMIWPGLSIGWTTQGGHLPGRPKCLHHRPAPHPHAVDEMTSWEQKTWLHTKGHVLYRLFMTTAWCSFCSFSIETLSHISKYCPFPDGIIITSRISF